MGPQSRLKCGVSLLPIAFTEIISRSNLPGTAVMSNKIKILILNVKSRRRIFCLSNFILTLDVLFPIR